jgi:hypothetical protein
MTNRIAFFLALFIIALVVLDVVVFDSKNLIFLGKKLLEFIEYIAFWR